MAKNEIDRDDYVAGTALSRRVLRATALFPDYPRRRGPRVWSLAFNPSPSVSMRRTSVLYFYRASYVAVLSRAILAKFSAQRNAFYLAYRFYIRAVASDARLLLGA